MTIVVSKVATQLVFRNLSAGPGGVSDIITPRVSIPRVCSFAYHKAESGGFPVSLGSFLVLACGV